VININNVIFGPNNQGSHGGAIFLQYTVFFLCTLCTFVGNIATVGGGGGIYVYKAPYVHLLGVNFTANQAVPYKQVIVVAPSHSY